MLLIEAVGGQRRHRRLLLIRLRGVAGPPIAATGKIRPAKIGAAVLLATRVKGAVRLRP